MSKNEVPGDGDHSIEGEKSGAPDAPGGSGAPGGGGGAGRHFVSVRRAGSGCLVPYVKHAVGTGGGGAPLVVGVCMEKGPLSGLLLCSDEPVPTAAGFENALVNPGKALSMAVSARSVDGAAPVNQFRVLEQVLVSLDLAGSWIVAGARLDGGASDAIDAQLAAEDVGRWCKYRMTQLSGKDPCVELQVPGKVMKSAKALWWKGRRLGARWNQMQGGASRPMLRQSSEGPTERLGAAVRRLHKDAQKMLRYLARPSCGPVFVGDLEEELGVSDRQVHKFSRALRKFGPGPLIASHNRRGYWILEFGIQAARLLPREGKEV